MKRILVTLALLLVCIPAYGASRSTPRLMAHYMPWFTTRETGGSWGWHWTMNHFNPDQVDAKGKRQIASHYYPLIGPYDSSDADVLEYHVLLMKFSGIDGVIVDWYGTEDFYDFAVVHKNTEHLIKHLKKAHLHFAVCYEDWTIKEMVAKRYIRANDAIKHAQGVMKWLDSNWFRDPGYLKLGNRPVLLVFGPRYFKQDEWKTIFSPLSTKPHFYPEDNPLPSASGSFPWPPMWASGKGILKPERLQKYLQESYKKAQKYKYSIGAAFPSFHDIYKEANNHNSFGYLDSRNGATYKETLECALKNRSDIVQIITWNDFGEGTMIEPTQEFGYKYLEMTQTISKIRIDRFFKYTSKHLRIPLQLYLLRKKHKNNGILSQQLDKAADLLFADKIHEGCRTLHQISANRDKPSATVKNQE